MDTIQWEGTFKRYAQSWVAKNWWRVSHVTDRDDCLQECAIVFTKCRNYYVRDPRRPTHRPQHAKYNRVNNEKWFMSLYKTALSRHWIHLARVKARQGKVLDAECEMALIHAPSATYNDGAVLAALNSASKELRSVLRLIANTPQEALAYLLTAEDDTHSVSGIRARVLTELREMLT